MKKPKICFVNPPVLLKRPISEIIYHMSQKGYKTSLLIPKKLFKKRDASLHHSGLVEKSRIYTYSIVNPPFGSEQPIPITVMFPINIFKALKNNDIIHMWVPYYLTSLNIILMKKIFYPKKKLILTMDTVPGYSFSMGSFWNGVFKIYNALWGWALFGTPEIITLYGKSLVPYAVKAGVPKNKIRVISTGIDIKQKTGKEKSGIKKELNIKPKTIIVLFVGLITPRKGIEKIIKIAYKLRKENIIFLLAGDGPKRKEYQKQVKELKLEEKVLFVGWRTDIHRFYRESDMLLLPAEGEGLPGVVMEAMTVGLPCIASNIPCIPDLIENGKHGFLCGKENINEFAKKILLLSKNSKLRNKIALNAKKKIKDFEWSKVLKKYEELYK